MKAGHTTGTEPPRGSNGMVPFAYLASESVKKLLGSQGGFVILLAMSLVAPLSYLSFLAIMGEVFSGAASESASIAAAVENVYITGKVVLFCLVSCIVWGIFNLSGSRIMLKLWDRQDIAAGDFLYGFIHWRKGLAIMLCWLVWGLFSLLVSLAFTPVSWSLESFRGSGFSLLSFTVACLFSGFIIRRLLWGHGRRILTCLLDLVSYRLIDGVYSDGWWRNFKAVYNELNRPDYAAILNPMMWCITGKLLIDELIPLNYYISGKGVFVSSPESNFFLFCLFGSALHIFLSMIAAGFYRLNMHIPQRDTTHIFE